MNPAQAKEVKLIKIAQRALQLDDATYRDMLSRLCGGKTSATDLDATERRRVLRHMKASGFVVKSKAPATGSEWRREPQMRKLRAMWYQLAEAGAVDNPDNSVACDAAIETWAKRQLDKPGAPFSALRFADGEQMNKLIEEMKRWGLRVGARIV